jgi:hypothetical protein
MSGHLQVPAAVLKKRALSRLGGLQSLKDMDKRHISYSAGN